MPEAARVLGNRKRKRPGIILNDEYDAQDLLHGSYGIKGEDIVLTEALQMAHLEYEEFLASYESMTLALTSHMRELAAFREVR